MRDSDAVVATAGDMVARMPAVEITPVRSEIKLPMSSMLLADVEAWVRVHPAHWRRPFPSRQVNNIYFDTPTYAGLNANLGGIGDRAKLRLRWYGEQLHCVKDAHLELKRKRGMTGWKEIVPVPGAIDLDAASWPEVTGVLADAAGSVAQQWFRQFPIPVLINRYHRDYYATPDDVVRLTVDRALRAYGQRASRIPNLRRSALLNDEIVVELKAPTGMRAAQRLSDALSYFPPSVTRFSKYVQGVLATPDFL